MKIWIASDLHLEFPDNQDVKVSTQDADVAVLAGDIGVGTSGIEWAADTFDIPVIYVSGNHEHYYRDFSKHTDDLRAYADELGIHFLERSVVEIDGVRFAGCTLWTDYNVLSDAKRAMEVAEVSISDHYLIRNGDSAFMPSDALRTHETSKAWLSGLRNVDVVITHHCPSTVATESCQRVKGNEPFYVSNLDSLISEIKPKAWIFGHTHKGVHHILPNGSTLLSNPHGYPGESSSETGWNPDLVYEIVR